MSHFDQLSQPGSGLFITDGGLETEIIFDEGIDLPNFASFVLLNSEKGKAALGRYYRRYLDIAKKSGHGFVLESPTWRANLGWAEAMGVDRDELIDINRCALEFVKGLRNEYSDCDIPIIISGNIGPSGDGYTVDGMLSGDEARTLHALQVDTFASHGADVVTALTMTYPDEAIGIVKAANAAGIPAVIGFTTETDGRLPDGKTLKSAIGQVDEATDGGPAYYMVNCAHTEHFSGVLEDGEAWTRRIRGIRANASKLSHAELDECEELDAGDPQEFGQLNRDLHDRFPEMTVFGGCCGTDHRHIEETVKSIGKL
jgi:S-methylmethionine-dependent homocysteine/selenocysteine methylase